MKDDRRQTLQLETLPLLRVTFFHIIYTILIVQMKMIIWVLVIAENDNSVQPMINRDEDVMSSEHTSTSSDNNSDSLEYIDDGYEQPYTTLMVTGQIKDEHVYLTTKKESNYEKSVPTQNVACGHACEILEEDSLSDTDETNAHDEHENLNLNYDVNDINETNDSLPQPNVNPQTNKAEYINLLLYQKH